MRFGTRHGRIEFLPSTAKQDRPNARDFLQDLLMPSWIRAGYFIEDEGADARHNDPFLRLLQELHPDTLKVRGLVVEHMRLDRGFDEDAKFPHGLIIPIWWTKLQGRRRAEPDLRGYTVRLARYPAEIYKRFAGGTLWFTLVFIMPVLMVSNLPANVVVRTFEPFMVLYVLGSGVVLLGMCVVVFRFALRWYRSASS